MTGGPLEVEAFRMIQEADRCARLAAKTREQTVASSLRELAEWYRAMAEELLKQASE